MFAWAWVCSPSSFLVTATVLHLLPHDFHSPHHGVLRSRPPISPGPRGVSTSSSLCLFFCRSEFLQPVLSCSWDVQAASSARSSTSSDSNLGHLCVRTHHGVGGEARTSAPFPHPCRVSLRRVQPVGTIPHTDLLAPPNLPNAWVPFKPLSSWKLMGRGNQLLIMITLA